MIELDASVRPYLPWFRVADPEASGRITVRHLLTQTSGMSMLSGTACPADLDDRPQVRERQARGRSTLEFSRPVGESFRYCNLHYNVLGLVIEAAGEQSYAEYGGEHICAALDRGPTRASSARAEQHGPAMGHRYWPGMPVPAADMPRPRGPLAAGGLISTSEDVAHSMMAHLNGGRYEGINGSTQILSSSSIEEMHRGAAEQRVLGRPVAAYGMGWFVGKIGETTLVSRGRQRPRFLLLHRALPGAAKGRVLLTGSDHGLPMIRTEVGEGLAALVAGEQPPPIRFGFFPWMMRALSLVPLLQCAGVEAPLRSLPRWRREPTLCPNRGRLWGRHILLPLVPNLSLVADLELFRGKGLLPLPPPLDAGCGLARDRLRRHRGTVEHRVDGADAGLRPACHAEGTARELTVAARRIPPARRLLRRTVRWSGTSNQPSPPMATSDSIVKGVRTPAHRGLDCSHGALIRRLVRTYSLDAGSRFIEPPPRETTRTPQT